MIIMMLMTLYSIKVVFKESKTFCTYQVRGKNKNLERPKFIYFFLSPPIALFVQEHEYVSTSSKQD